jgi:hypothetical protein
MAEARHEQRFGAVAMLKGFITIKQLIEAIKIQVELEVQRGEHKLLGDVLIEMGVMDASQIDKVLKVLKKIS